MKNRILTLSSLFGMGLLVAGASWAQAQSQSMPAAPATQSTTSTPPAPAQATPAPASSSPAPTAAAPSPSANGASSGANSANSATYNTSQGQVTINSTTPTAPSTASPPSFEQLAGKKKYISKDDANAYPPLANDFLYVSHNGNRITKAQYERWVKDLN